MIERILDMASVSTALAHVTLLHRFVSNIANVVMLAAASAFMCCVMLLAGFAAIYLGLLHYGADPYVAALIILALLALVTAALIVFTSAHMRELKRFPYNRLFRDVPALSYVSSVLDAFLEGLQHGSGGRS